MWIDFVVYYTTGKYGGAVGEQTRRVLSREPLADIEACSQLNRNALHLIAEALDLIACLDGESLEEMSCTVSEILCDLRDEGYAE